MDENNLYYNYTYSNCVINSISTNKKKYRCSSEYNNVVKEFMTLYNLYNYYLDDVDDHEISKFVKYGTHYNGTIDFKDHNIENVKHIDMKKAYVNFKTCKFYKGFLGKIQHFRECNKIVDIGLYQICNIDFSNCDERIRKLNDRMKIYNENFIYPSPELEMLLSYGVKFDIIRGC